MVYADMKLWQQLELSVLYVQKQLQKIANVCTGLTVVQL